MKNLNLWIVVLVLAVGMVFTACKNETAEPEDTQPQTTEPQSTETEPTEQEVLEANFFVLEKTARFDADGELLGNCIIELNEDGLPITVTDDTEGADSKQVSELCYDEEGNLRSVATTSGEGKSEIKHERVFDEKGNVTDELYSMDGEEPYGYQYEYDENGNCVAATMAAFIGDDRIEFEYDENGNMVKKTLFWVSGRIDVSLYEYDERGNLLKDTGFVNDKETTRNEYSYDENGNLLTMIEFYRQEESKREEYEYDSSGNLLKKAVIQDGKEMQTNLYEYGQDGTILKETVLKEGAAEEVCEYDQEGNLLIEIYYSDGEERYRTEYVYNDRGQETEVSEYTDDETTRTVYEYAENGLLIKETIYIDDVLEEYTTYTWYENNGYIKDKNVELIRVLFNMMSPLPEIFAEK